jgi:hypothetical protein
MTVYISRKQQQHQVEETSALVPVETFRGKEEGKRLGGGREAKNASGFST